MPARETGSEGGHDGEDDEDEVKKSRSTGGCHADVICRSSGVPLSALNDLRNAVHQLTSPMMIANGRGTSQSGSLPSWTHTLHYIFTLLLRLLLPANV